MDARSLVFAAGDRITGAGRLVHIADADWFDPPLPHHLIYYGDGRPAPKPSGFAIRVDGADFDTVARRYERDGAIEGYATVTGSWLDERIRIERQAPGIPEHRSPDWTTPPCPAPPGGWPHLPPNPRGLNLDFDLGDLDRSGAAVNTVIFRPSDDQAVLVVAATDIAAVEAKLRPQLPDLLCVVPSRFTKPQLDRAREHLAVLSDRWRIYEWGPHCDEQAQPSMSATLVRVTEEIADWVESQADGLIELHPWLVPAS